MAFPKPTNKGVANKNNMIVPCMVNIWLYCSFVTNCKPGLANSALMTIAINPAIMKKINEVIK
jgi:hypothetical protein